MYVYVYVHIYIYIIIYMPAILPKPHPRMRMNACSMSAFRSWPSGLTSSSPWRWTGNQQLQDTRREGLVSRGRLLETPWISQFTQIGHGFYLFIYCSILGLLYYIPLKKNLCSIVCIDNGKHWPWQQLLQDGNEGQRTFKTAAGYENSKVPKGLGSHSHQVLGNICRRLLCFCFSPLTYG